MDSFIQEDSIDVEVVEQKDKRLGRNKVHDSRSRAFAAGEVVDPSTWRTRSIRIYDPLPNPNQRVGCCTGVAKAVQLNASGNRNPRRIRPWSTKTSGVLDMVDAENMYSRNSQIDPWEGSWPPDDTGSSGLASAKTARELGWAGEYRWIFNGADGVVQEIMAGRTVSVGTWWYNGMFDLDERDFIHPTGGMAGGHQWTAYGYVKSLDAVRGRCWWGKSFRNFYIHRLDLDALLWDDGDAHVQATT